MNIIYIGKFFPKGILKSILAENKTVIGLSNHNFEMSIINGLCRYDDINVQCITIPAVYSFPHNNKRIYTNPESYDYKNSTICSVGFCNLIFIKDIWALISMAMQILKSINRFNDDRVDVIINTPDIRLLSALKIARLFTNKRITQTVIIPDIPSVITSMGKQMYIKDMILRHLDKVSMAMTSMSNGLVLLTEEMMDFIQKPVKHIVMEGIIDVESMDVSVEEVEEKQVILYTGTLRRIFGVIDLLDAFSRLNNQDVELWICGSGDAALEIETAAKFDSRIKFWGLVDSRTSLELQRKAMILVNPRTSQGVYTKYSFPSKTMEYLLSGRSVIINRLPGIPEEYYDYVYTPVDQSVEALSQCISDVLSMNPDRRKSQASKGRDFVISKKNSKVQVERILNMINTYIV